MARITAWEPGTRLAWQSSVDDVETEVRFDQSGDGTLVRVQAVIPEGGVDRGGTAFARMTPPWFGDWVAKRDHVAHEPQRLARLAVAVHYSKPATAARWLRDVFGFEPAGNIPEIDTDNDHTWIEFHVGNSSVMVFGRSGDRPEHAPPTHTPWVFVDDLDAHYAQAKTGGAGIVDEIWHHGVRAVQGRRPRGESLDVRPVEPAHAPCRLPAGGLSEKLVLCGFDQAVPQSGKTQLAVFNGAFPMLRAGGSRLDVLCRTTSWPERLLRMCPRRKPSRP